MTGCGGGFGKGGSVCGADNGTERDDNVRCLCGGGGSSRGRVAMPWGDTTLTRPQGQHGGGGGGDVKAGG